MTRMSGFTAATAAASRSYDMADDEDGDVIRALRWAMPTGIAFWTAVILLVRRRTNRK